MSNSEFFRGFCFGLGQSAAGFIIIGLFGERICKYIINTIEKKQIKENDENKTDLTMQNLYSKCIKNYDESLLSDGETIQIKPKINLKKL